MALTATERADLIGRYAAGPEELAAALARVPAEALTWRPAAGAWSAHEVVVHCADSEANAALRIRYLVAEREPTIVGYDQEAWAETLAYHDHPLGEALTAVRAVRANTLPLLRRLGEADWARVGRHTESGPYGAEDWLRIYGVHLRDHAEQIAANVAAWEARTP